MGSGGDGEGVGCQGRGTTGTEEIKKAKNGEMGPYHPGVCSVTFFSNLFDLSQAPPAAAGDGDGDSVAPEAKKDKADGAP